MEVTLASVIASAIDPVKIALSFGIVLASRRSYEWLDIALGVALVAYVCLSVWMLQSPGAILLVHILSCVALLSVAAITLKFAGNVTGSIVGAAMCTVSLGAVWFAISASAQNAVPSMARELTATTGTQLTASEAKPAHSFLYVQTTEADPSNPELRWLSRQTEEYQAAIFRGELPERESEQRKIGLMILGLRKHFREDADIVAFLLSANSLPFLVELRSILHNQLLHVDDADGVHMLMYASEVRINSRVQSILTAIQARAAM